MVRIADSSALYALFSSQDAHHEEARAQVEDPEPIVVPGEIHAETLALIQYRGGFDLAREAGKALRGLPHVDVQATTAELREAAWAAFGESGGALSFPDAIVIAWCRTMGSAPLAFDAELVERAT